MAGPAGPQRGFRECFLDLADRKDRELGTPWAGVNSRFRRAEAGRRAREEMLRRIETRTGRRYAPSTIARWAARQHWPPGVDTFWLERWAAIDRAGGIRALADALGSTPQRVVTWRDSLDPNAPPPGPVAVAPPAEVLTVWVSVEGYATVGTTLIYKNIPTGDAEHQELEIVVGAELLEAWINSRQERVKEILGEAIAEQVIAEWNPAQFYDVDYTVTDVIDLRTEL
ncbi:MULTISPECIES: hypothetical protein [Mycolicibacter]|uniref:XRE family transcriptional regulator n=2 Tax=Mycolicibacter TaxID=1073531 RepID=A0ABU5XME7_9MYCO|nr:MULTISPECIES: hypothetical protein [unclassified Mycolicibacter]MEB3023440.1 hypothetical protein [Mycolicibacter sp. MYC098]MEB3033782.1 hypothetical protein [Mycolicibacter sp. MYC340]